MVSKRMTIFESENLVIDLEYNDSFFVLHLPYIVFSLTTFRILQEKLEELQKFSEVIGYEGVYGGIPAQDPNLKRLMKLLKATYLGDSDGVSVYRYK